MTTESKAPLTVSIAVPSLSEFVGVVRLSISGIATRMNFSVEDIEDIKVAVSEACTNAVQYAYPDSIGMITINCILHDEKLEISIEDQGKGFNTAAIANKTPDFNPAEEKNNNDTPASLGLGFTFIKSLMDDYDISSSVGKGTIIRMSKKVPVLVPS